MVEIGEPNLNEIIDSWCDNYGVILPEIIREKWLTHLKNSDYKHKDPPDEIFMEIYRSYDSDAEIGPEVKRKPTNTLDGVFLFVQSEFVEEVSKFIASKISERGLQEK